MSKMWDRLIGPEANARIEREERDAELARLDALEQAAPEGYRLAIHPGDRTMLCERCGALIADQYTHDQWHAQV